MDRKRHLIHFGRVLSIQSYESKIRGARPYRRHGWSDNVLEGGLWIDLSKVEFADFGALARVACLCEGALRHAANVNVSLPVGHIGESELAYLESIARSREQAASEYARISGAARRRARSLEFMRRSGFIGCLRPAHLMEQGHNLSIKTEESPVRWKGRSKHRQIFGISSETPDPLIDYSPVVIPLAWVPNWDSEDRLAWEREIIRLLQLKAPSLSVGDAEAIATVVLRELVNNIVDHATERHDIRCAPAALVGALIVADGATVTATVEGRYISQEYHAWLKSSGSPVIRLIVADSGIGIPDTLGPPPPDYDQHVYHGPLSLTSVEKSILWSLSSWSSRRVVLSPGGRGLASVRRVIQKANGYILIRSGDGSAGVAYPDGSQVGLAAGHLAYNPGTLFDICLVSNAFRSPKLDRTASEDLVRILGIYKMDFGRLLPVMEMHGLSNTAVYPQRALTVVIGYIPDDPDEAYRCLAGLIHISRSHNRLIVLLAPQQSRIELAPRIRAFDDSRMARAKTAGLIMILDQSDAIQWAGVSSRQMKLLGILERAYGEVITLNSLCSTLAIDMQTLREALDGLKPWVEASDRGARLGLSSFSIVEALLIHILKRAAVIARASAIVPQNGRVIVAPTLASASSWVDIDELVNSIGGFEFVGYVLGQIVKDALPGEVLTEVGIAAVGPLNRAILGAFRDAAGFHRRLVTLSGEVGVYDDPEVPFVRTGSSLVLLTDAVLSGDRVRHAMSDLLRMGARLVAVVTIVDGRLDGAPDRMNALGVSVPLFSVVRSAMQLGSGVPDELADIEYYMHPTMLPPGLQLPDAQVDYPISAQRNLSWTDEAKDGVLVGHIVRHSRRHFYSFLDFGAVLANPDLRDEIVSAGIAEIAAWMTLHADVTESIAVLHAGERGDSAGMLATSLAHTWNSQSSVIMRTPMAIPRILSAGRWVLPVPDDIVMPGTAVLVVDWGAVTLDTVTQLMRSAGRMGAHAVLAVVATSQLNPQDLQSTLSLRALGVPGGIDPEVLVGSSTDPVTATERVIPAKVVFLSQFAVAYAPASDCILCRYATEYGEAARSAPTDLLRSHASRWAETLEPIELADARRYGPRDLLHAPLDGSHVRTMVETWRTLNEAVGSTEVRVALFHSIRGQDDEGIDALVRLVTLDPRLVKMAPLRHEQFRRLIARRCIDRIQSGAFVSAPVELQRQYAVALRTVSKEEFLQVAPGWIIEALRESALRPLVYDIIWGLYTFSIRPYHRDSKYGSAIRNVLTEILGLIVNAESEGIREQALDVAGTVSLLLATVDYADSSQVHMNASKQEAWGGLRAHYYGPVMDHAADIRMGSIRAAVTTRRFRDRQAWRDTLRDWHMTQQFLVQHVLPRLPALRDIVLARLYERGNAEDPGRWSRACTPDVISDLSDIERILTRFATSPDLATEKKEQAQGLIFWWYRIFFDKNAPEGMLHLLGKCPCNLNDAVDSGIAAAIEELDDVTTSIRLSSVATAGLKVFCDNDLLMQAVKQLVLNCYDPRHRVEPAKSDGVDVTVSIHCDEHGAQATVTVMNTGTKKTERYGRGINYFDRSLGGYGGFVRGSDDQLRGPWTFKAQIGLDKWST